MIGPLRAAIAKAIIRARKGRAMRSTCSACGREAALLGVTFEGVKLGFLCRFCPWDSFTTAKKGHG